jgi:dihydrodipicolinate synthase/N-acetylneuraminate lyase
MVMKNTQLNPAVERLLHEGTVIPAHPLALTHDLKIDENRQRALTRYYLACGVGGLAVGVHTTQFEIRKPEFNFLETVLRITREEISEEEKKRPLIKVAGICGPTTQALKEAELAMKYGYDLGLVSLGGLNAWSDAELIEHIVSIAAIIPVFGFYLQPSVGGRLLSFEYWRDFVEIPNVLAIKIAAFNRYQTLDVFRAVC